MKRLTAFLLLFLMLFSLCACSQEKEIVYPVTYHYLRSPLPGDEISHGAADSVIATDVRDGNGYQNDYTYLLDIYLLGPLDRNCRSPFPVGTNLKNLSLENGAATILLSDDFAELSGIDLTLACSCLTLTVMDMTGVESVTIRAEDSLLDGKESITMDASMLILVDHATPATE